LADEAPLIVYAGSLGPHYHPDRVTFFAARVQAARPDAHLLCLTGTPEVALAAARAQGLAGGSYTVRAVPPEQVPHYLAAADLGLAFRTPSLSQLAVAPIKVGEYLLCGVPVLGSGGIGDLNEQLDSTTARLLDSLDDAALDAAAEWFVEEVLPARELYRSACRARGMEHFSLQGSVARYREAFNRLAVP
jgi:glycosyltransferase involved in cell wall biosynthesis